jgi:uncharacterized protein YjbI with pentapeptide repeats
MHETNFQPHDFGEADVRGADVKGADRRPAGANIVRVGEHA